MMIFLLMLKYKSFSTNDSFSDNDSKYLHDNNILGRNDSIENYDIIKETIILLENYSKWYITKINKFSYQKNMIK
jgi:hypothetical protein